MPASIRASPDLPVPRRWGDQRQRNLPTQLLKLGSAASAEERLAALEEAVARIGLDVYQPDPQVMTPEEEHRAKLADGINYVGEAALSLQGGYVAATGGTVMTTTAADIAASTTIVCPVPSLIFVAAMINVRCTSFGGAGFFVPSLVAGGVGVNTGSFGRWRPSAADEYGLVPSILSFSVVARSAYSLNLQGRTTDAATGYTVQVGGGRGTSYWWVAIPEFRK